MYLKKGLLQASKSKKDQRELAAALREEKEKPAKRVVKNAKEATTSGSVVKRVKLSEGGLVDLQKPGAGFEEDSEDDEEEDESKPVSSFFLNPNSKGSFLFLKPSFTPITLSASVAILVCLRQTFTLFRLIGSFYYYYYYLLRYSSLCD